MSPRTRTSLAAATAMNRDQNEWMEQQLRLYDNNWVNVVWTLHVLGWYGMHMEWWRWVGTSCQAGCKHQQCASLLFAWRSCGGTNVLFWGNIGKSSHRSGQESHHLFAIYKQIKHCRCKVPLFSYNTSRGYYLKLINIGRALYVKTQYNFGSSCRLSLFMFSI